MKKTFGLITLCLILLLILFSLNAIDKSTKENEVFAETLGKTAREKSIHKKVQENIVKSKADKVRNFFKTDYNSGDANSLLLSNFLNELCLLDSDELCSLLSVVDISDNATPESIAKYSAALAILSYFYPDIAVVHISNNQESVFNSGAYLLSVRTLASSMPPSLLREAFNKMEFKNSLINASFANTVLSSLADQHGENESLKFIEDLAADGKIGYAIEYFASLEVTDENYENLISKFTSLNGVSNLDRVLVIDEIAMNLAESNPFLAFDISHKYDTLGKGSNVEKVLLACYDKDSSKFFKNLNTLKLQELSNFFNAPASRKIFNPTNSDKILSVFESVPNTADGLKLIESISNRLISCKVDIGSVVAKLPNGYTGSGYYKLFKEYADLGGSDSTNSINNIPQVHKESALRGIISSLTAKDSAKALSLISVSEISDKRNLYKEYAKGLVYSDIPAALKLLSAGDIQDNFDKNFRDGMIREIINIKSSESLLESSELLNTISFKDREPAYAALITTWMKTDPIAASEWLSQQPAGPARDAGAQEIINQIKDTDPEMAEQWRKSMTPKTE